MASSGFQADVKALQKVLSARHLVSPRISTLIQKKLLFILQTFSRPLSTWETIFHLTIFNFLVSIVSGSFCLLITR